MNKPPYPHLPSLQPTGRNFQRSSSPPFEAFSDFMSIPLNYSGIIHHYLETCKHLPLLERIWKHYRSYPFIKGMIMKINGDMLLFMSRFGDFTLLFLLEFTIRQTQVGVFQSKLCGHSRPQLPLIVVPVKNHRGSDANTSFIIMMRMRWIWMKGGEEESAQCLSQ